MFSADSGTHGISFIFEAGDLVGASLYDDTSYEVAGCNDANYQAGAWPPVPDAWMKASEGSPFRPPASAACPSVSQTDFPCDADDLATLQMNSP